MIDCKLLTLWQACFRILAWLDRLTICKRKFGIWEQRSSQVCLSCLLLSKFGSKKEIKDNKLGLTVQSLLLHHLNQQ
jgi:hypothetical protein